MFNVGGAEVLVIALIALVVVGPEQLPSVLRKAGKQVAQLRAMANSVRDEFMSGVDEMDPNNWDSDSDAASESGSESVLPGPGLLAAKRSTTEPNIEAQDAASSEALAAQAAADEQVAELERAEKAAEEMAMGQAESRRHTAKFNTLSETPDPSLTVQAEGGDDEGGAIEGGAIEGGTE